MTYAFSSGADPDNEEPAFDATVIPYLSDDSDTTFLHFATSGGHDYLELYGDTAAIPSTPVTAITMTMRGRSSATAGGIWLVPYLFPSVDFIRHGYINYYGPDPALGIHLPVGSTFGEMTVTFDQAALDAALGPTSSDWQANNGSDGWTTVEGFVDNLRTYGFQMRWLYNGGSGTWDVSSFDMVFESVAAVGRLKVWSDADDEWLWQGGGSVSGETGVGRFKVWDGDEWRIAEPVPGEGGTGRLKVWDGVAWRTTLEMT